MRREKETKFSRTWAWTVIRRVIRRRHDVRIAQHLPHYGPAAAAAAAAAAGN